MNLRNRQAEESVIGTMLAYPSATKEAAALTATMFGHEDTMGVFMAIEATIDSGAMPEFNSVAIEIQKIPSVANLSHSTLFGWMQSANPNSLQGMVLEIAKCWQNRSMNEMILNGTRNAESVGYWSPTLVTEMLSKAKDISHQAEGRVYTLRKAEEGFVQFGTPPPDREWMLSVNGGRLAVKGALMQVAGAVKAGKSSVVFRIVASTAQRTGPENSFGIRVTENTSGHYVLSTDTEQSRDETYESVAGAFKAVGLKSQPKWMNIVNMRGKTYSQRVKEINALLMENADRFGGVHMVVLDSIKHFCGSFMDQKASQETVDWMLDMADKYQCVVICVNHLNSSIGAANQLKSTGWLGTFISGATSSSVFAQMDPKTKISKLDFGDLRRATVDDPIHYKFNPALGYHVLVDPPRGAKGDESDYDRNVPF